MVTPGRFFIASSAELAGLTDVFGYGEGFFIHRTGYSLLLASYDYFAQLSHFFA
jgi:hypothetical protein